MQVFDNNLVLQAIYDNVGNPWAVCISPRPHQYLFVSNSNPDSNPAASWAITGEIYKMELDGTIIGKFGKAGKGLGEFSTVHEIDCRNPTSCFVSEISAWRVQKIMLNPKPAHRRPPAGSEEAHDDAHRNRRRWPRAARRRRRPDARPRSCRSRRFRSRRPAIS